MQDSNTRQELDPIPDDEAFRKALLTVERFGVQLHEIARRQKELLAIEKDRAAKEADVLRTRAEEKDRALEAMRKTLIDAQMELSEARRNENSLSLEVKQLKEQVRIYKVDGERIDAAESQLRAARDENAALKTRLDEQAVGAAKAARDHKTELDALVLKYEQEKIQLNENVQVALEKARNVTDTIERYKSLAALAESEKNSAAEEMEKTRAQQKEQIDKLRGELAAREARVSEQDRILADVQRDYERKLSLAQSQAEQKYQSELEKLRHTNEDQLHELNRTRYTMELLKEDHARAIEALKQDMEKQITLRADEIRRQFMLKSPAAETQA